MTEPCNIAAVLPRLARERGGQVAQARQDTGQRASAADSHQRGALLDAQSQLRRGVAPGPRADPSRYRDYARLAGVAGVTPSHYEHSAPGEQRRLRAEIDRAIAARPLLDEAAPDAGARPRPRSAQAESDTDRRRRQFGARAGRRDD